MALVLCPVQSSNITSQQSITTVRALLSHDISDAWQYFVVRFWRLLLLSGAGDIPESILMPLIAYFLLKPPSLDPDAYVAAFSCAFAR